jgi:hypothetical protein
MKRRFAGLNQANGASTESVPDGLYLVRVERVQYRWHKREPYFLLRFAILEPTLPRGSSIIIGHLYCTPKALWKLNWLLRDFGYDTELLGRDEIDEKALIGLCGVVKISHTVLHGTSLLNFDGFAPASQWESLSGVGVEISRSKVAS